MYHVAVEIQLLDVILLLALVRAVLWLAFPRPGQLRRAGSRLAVANQAYVDSEFVAEFDRAEVLDRRLRAAVLVPMAVGVWVVYELPGLSGLAVGIIGCGYVAIAILPLVRAGKEFTPRPGRPTLARLREVRFTDYVHPLALLTCVVTAIAGLAAAVGALQVGAFKDGSTHHEQVSLAVSGGIVGVLALVTPLYFMVLCRRPEPAVDAAHLYFQDAWRASHMREALALVAVAAILLTTRVAALDLSGWLGGGLWMALMLVVLGCFAASDHWGRLRFRRRLWPTLAPDQVLLPGEPVPAGGPA